MEWGVLIAVILAAGAALASMKTDPLYTPETRRLTGVVLLGFAVYVIAGITIALVLPLDNLKQAGMIYFVLALLSYLFYGMLWILRLTPSRRPPPAWVLKPWTRLDFVMLVLFLVGVGGTVWGALAA